MATMSLILILGLLITLSLDFTVGQIGVNYGRNGGGLPAPSQVVALYQRYGIQRMRIYDTDPGTLQAVSGSNIEITVGILNRDLQNIAASPGNADAWVRDNIRRYPNVRFRHIVVGNEVSPIRNGEFTQFVLPALRNVYNSISAAGLGRIKVTTAIETEVLEPSSSYPPENGMFRSNVAPYLNPIIRFLMDTDAPIFANIYPYFAYIYNPQINLRYALLDPSFEGVVTPNGVRYQNLFQALLDAVYSALERSAAAMATASPEAWTDAGRNIRNMEVKGGESGWSSRGGRHAARIESAVDDVTNVDTARTYINNLVQAVKKGTPKRPGQVIETYIFAMFDENQKPGDETERNFGLFSPNGQPKYQVNFN